jgi:hypothetical protein
MLRVLRVPMAFTLCTVSRQELVGWLQHEIAEQKRIDTATSGAPTFAESPLSALPKKDISSSPNVLCLLPTDTKKQRKTLKQYYVDRGLCFRNSHASRVKCCLIL